VPSAFDESFEANCLPLAMAYNGEPVVYATLDGASKVIMAIVDHGEGWQEQAEHEGIRVPYATEIKVALTDCPNLSRGDKFTLGGVDFWIESVSRSNDAGLATVRVTRTIYTEKSDGGMRRQKR
jgi:hypothetical protein